MRGNTDLGLMRRWKKLDLILWMNFKCRECFSVIQKNPAQGLSQELVDIGQTTEVSFTIIIMIIGARMEFAGSMKKITVSL